MSGLSEHELELAIARMLKIGVTIAALLVLAGAILLFRTPNISLPDYKHFHSEDVSLLSFSGIISGAFHLRAKSVIQFGLLVLIATPVARVIFCVGGFWRQRNFLYVGVSSVVLAVLIYSLTRGAH
ncbi:MAG: DUF1634 domain-containing protein [Bryocella sp.]